MINLKVKRLTKTARLPTKAHNTDACFDLYADCLGREYHWYSSHEDGDVYKEGVYIPSHCSVLINTGISTEIPEGYFAAIYPRSSMGIKKHLRLSNSTGVIDASYRGEWLVSLFNDGPTAQVIQHGDRIAQFAILPVPDVAITEVDELNETERGTGGFGSSGT